MFRKSLILVLCLMLSWTSFGCVSDTTKTGTFSREQIQRKPFSASILPAGKYPLQQASYDDANGVYSLMLLGTPAGTSPMFETQKLQMARLTDDQIKQNVKSYLEVRDQESVLYLTEDFKIDYVHNVTQEDTNSQTGERQQVVIRQETSAWNPFLGALAGQAIGSALFSPRYYIPPIYQGGTMSGFGGYGSSYDGAVQNYKSRYNEPPASVKNRQVFRNSGSFSSNGFSSSKKNYSSKSTGAGFSSSRLNSYGKSYSSSRNSFGSANRRRSGFGSYSRGRRR